MHFYIVFWYKKGLLIIKFETFFGLIYIDNIWIQMLVFLVEMIYMENILHIYVDIIENCNNSLAICDGV